MKLLSPFVLSIVVLTLAVAAVGQDKSSAAEIGRFVSLKQGDGREFRAFVAGPVDAKAAVLIVHDYFGVSDATKQSVQHLGVLGYRLRPKGNRQDFADWTGLPKAARQEAGDHRIQHRWTGVAQRESERSRSSERDRDRLWVRL